MRALPLLQPIINNCLCKDVSDRYGSVDELLFDLKQAREQIKNPKVESTKEKWTRRWQAAARVLVALYRVAIRGDSVCDDGDSEAVLYRRAEAERAALKR